MRDFFERHSSRSIEGEGETRAKEGELELVTVRREKTTTQPRDENCDQHLKSEDSPRQPGEHSEQDCQSSTDHFTMTTHTTLAVVA